MNPKYANRRSKHPPLRQRFYSRIEYDTNGGCWLWAGATGRNGYGGIGTGGRTYRGAHCVSYEMHKGPIPPGLHVLHRCDVPSCVNPDHLFLGTRAANMADMAMKGRRRPRGPYKRVRPDQASKIRTMIDSGASVRVVAREFGVSPGTVRFWSRRQ